MLQLAVETMSKSICFISAERISKLRCDWTADHSTRHRMACDTSGDIDKSRLSIHDRLAGCTSSRTHLMQNAGGRRLSRPAIAEVTSTSWSFVYITWVGSEFSRHSAAECDQDSTIQSSLNGTYNVDVYSCKSFLSLASLSTYPWMGLGEGQNWSLGNKFADISDLSSARNHYDISETDLYR